MMNIYDGNVTLDHKGQAIIVMPAYLNALNKDFRYQLTPIGAAAPRLYIAEKKLLCAPPASSSSATSSV
jgi:hypothetical protein